jgi:trigger factor
MKFSLTFTRTKSNRPNKALEKMASQLTLKGFRQGKAPWTKSRQAVGQEKVIEETVNQLIPAAYMDYVKEAPAQAHHSAKNLHEENGPDGDWEFEVEIAEKPEVKLNNYQDAIKSELAKESIWTPDKDNQPIRPTKKKPIPKN